MSGDGAAVITRQGLALRRATSTISADLPTSIRPVLRPPAPDRPARARDGGSPTVAARHR
jgi:hypothetical protein